jgi:hypothetical protein
VAPQIKKNQNPESHRFPGFFFYTAGIEWNVKWGNPNLTGSRDMDTEDLSKEA